jgi:GT2 family glycosyltransferase
MSRIECAVVMLVHDRPRLTRQALTSLKNNTPLMSYKLIVVADNLSDLAMPELSLIRGDDMYICHPGISGCIGAMRNLGAWVIGQREMPKYIHFVDNDVYFMPNWLEVMSETLDKYGRALKILGGERHPFHKPLYVMGGQNNQPAVEVVDAVAGYSMFMRYESWLSYGPFDENGRGVGASEDWAICQKVHKRGGAVGYVSPRMVLHCGITNSRGERAIGADQIEKNRMKGVLYE